MLSQEEPIHVRQQEAPSDSETDETPQRQDGEGFEDAECFSGDDEAEREEFGYEQLPMDDDSDVATMSTPGHDHVISPDAQKEPVLPQPLEYSLKTYSEARIDEADLEVIRNVMNKMPIPPMAVPNWANHLPEELWLPRRVED